MFFRGCPVVQCIKQVYQMFKYCFTISQVCSLVKMNYFSCMYEKVPISLCENCFFLGMEFWFHALVFVFFSSLLESCPFISFYLALFWSLPEFYWLFKMLSVPCCPSHPFSPPPPHSLGSSIQFVSNLNTICLDVMFLVCVLLGELRFWGMFLMSIIFGKFSAIPWVSLQPHFSILWF